MRLEGVGLGWGRGMGEEDVTDGVCGFVCGWQFEERAECCSGESEGEEDIGQRFCDQGMIRG